MEEHFLPVIVTDEAGEEKILNGEIEISDTKRLSMLRLLFDEQKKDYIPLQADAAVGNRSVIITKPEVFASRLNASVINAKPYFCQLEYLPAAMDVGFIIKKHPRLIGELNFPSSVHVKMDDISIDTDTTSLIRGNIPDKLYDAEIIEQFTKVRESPVGITACVESVVGDFTFVKAEQRWIDEFHKGLLHPDTWKQATIMDQVVSGGALSPCLSFWHTNGLDHIEIRRNCIKVCMQSSIDATDLLFQRLLDFLNGLKAQRYMHLCSEFILDLGMMESQYFPMTNIYQGFSFQGKDNFCSGHFRNALGKGMSIFGTESYERDWIFNLMIASHKDTNIPFWNAGDVDNFMEHAHEDALDLCSIFLEEDDKYKAFNRLRERAMQKYI